MSEQDLWKRRDFVRLTSAAAASLAGSTVPSEFAMANQQPLESEQTVPNMIGVYGNWASELAPQPHARLSFLRPEFQDIVRWQEQARRRRVRECLQQPSTEALMDPVIESTFEYDGGSPRLKNLLDK